MCDDMVLRQGIRDLRFIIDETGRRAASFLLSTNPGAPGSPGSMRIQSQTAEAQELWRTSGFMLDLVSELLRLEAAEILQPGPTKTGEACASSAAAGHGAQ